MMGVVLWSDVKDEKAVFWCDDHGDLVYFDATGTMGGGDGHFQPGDMVQFDVQIEDKTRRAHNVRIVESNICNSLLDGLRESAANNETASTVAISVRKVVPFRQRATFDQSFSCCENG